MSHQALKIKQSLRAGARTREHLTADEVERVIEAAKGNRHGHRDALMVLLSFRHGFRAAEICDLRWEQLDFKRMDWRISQPVGSPF